MIGVRRVDFLAQPVDDLRAAESWYGDTLGLPRNPNTSGEQWVEFETGNLTLALSTFGGGIALGVDDVEAARAELEQNGVDFSDTFDSGVCHVAPFADSFGNRLLLHHRYAPLEPFEAPSGTAERTDFVNIPVTDRARGIEFYAGTLGLERNPLSSEEWPEFQVGGTTLLLTMPEQTGTSFRAGDYAVSLRVADVPAEMERLRELGVEFQFPEPYDSSVCQMAFLRDPHGNALILHRRYAPYADGSTP